jgi:hypothetical protein
MAQAAQEEEVDGDGDYEVISDLLTGGARISYLIINLLVNYVMQSPA